MTYSRDRRRSLRLTLPILPIVLLLSACTAVGDPATETGLPSASPSASSVVTPSPEPTALVFPTVAAGEVARAEFVTVGADGVPQASSIASDAVGEAALHLEGACIGTRASYKVETAVPIDERRVLAEGTMRCDEPFRMYFPVTPYRGVVQLSFTDTDAIDTGWVRIVRDDAA